MYGSYQCWDRHTPHDLRNLLLPTVCALSHCTPHTVPFQMHCSSYRGEVGIDHRQAPQGHGHAFELLDVYRPAVVQLLHGLEPGVPQAQGLSLAGGFRDLGSVGLADLQATQQFDQETSH